MLHVQHTTMTVTLWLCHPGGYSYLLQGRGDPFLNRNDALLATKI